MYACSLVHPLMHPLVHPDAQRVQSLIAASPNSPMHVQKKRDKDRFAGKGKKQKDRNSKIELLQSTLAKVRSIHTPLRVAWVTASL